MTSKIVMTLLLFLAVPALGAEAVLETPLDYTPQCLTVTFNDGSPDQHFGTLPAETLVTPEEALPLNPVCNSCLDGIVCFNGSGTNVKMDCCSSYTHNCVKCAVCTITQIGGGHSLPIPAQ